MYRYPTNYIAITNGFHTGKSLDFGWCGHHNQDICSCGNGKVYKVEFQKTGGNTIFIEHTNGNVSCYGHLDTISVTKGQSVKIGDKIGTMGATGVCKGEHLHFGIYSQKLAKKGFNKKGLYGNSDINPFEVCYVYPDQDVSKVRDTYKKKLKYFEDMKIWEVGNYTLLGNDKALRKEHSLKNNIHKVKDFKGINVTLNVLTSEKPNADAYMKKYTPFKVREIYKEANGRVWGRYGTIVISWIVLCNVDGTPQAKRI